MILLSTIFVTQSCNDDCEDIDSNCYNVDPNYQPFPTQDAVWKVSWSQSACQGVCGQKQYYTNGDTVINNLTYTKIHVTHINIVNADTVDYLSGFIRNDIWNKKVYLLEHSGGATEVLLYDFNVAIADTIDHLGCSAILESIDTIMMTNFDLLKYNYNVLQNIPGATKYNFSIMESIGSTDGLFDPVSISTVNFHGSNLDCFKVLNTYSYPMNAPCN